jgi:hypothetical protein
VRTASTNFDATLLDAFSSDAARDDAIVRACILPGSGCSDGRR